MTRRKKDKEPELEKPVREDSKKRKKPDDDDLPLRRQRMAQPSESDEGFSESDDSDFDVKYVSENERYGFRKRRYCKPWWIRTAPINMRIKFEDMTKNDVRAEQKIKKIKTRTGINPKNACHGNNVFQPPPTEILKIMEELAFDKKKNNKVAKFLKPKQPKEKNNPKTVENDGIATAQSCTSVQTNTSVQTSQDSISPSETIYRAFRDLSNVTGVGRVVETTEAYGKLFLSFL